MTPTDAFDPQEITERFFTVIKSLNDFDKAEVRGVIQTLIAPRERDLCFTGNYYRGVANVETVLSLKNVRDFQAIAMLARALFELAVEVGKYNLMTDSRIYPSIRFGGLKVFFPNQCEHAGHFDKPPMTMDQVFGLARVPGGLRMATKPNVLIIA